MEPFNAKTYMWAKCMPEVLVSDFKSSLAFYKMLGFVDMYQRDNFAYLDYQGAQIMIDQRNGYWETGHMEQPFGRGVNFQITTNELDAVIARLEQAGMPLYEPKYETWRDLGGQQGGFIEFLVQDPDGYLLRFSQVIS